MFGGLKMKLSNNVISISFLLSLLWTVLSPQLTMASFVPGYDAEELAVIDSPRAISYDGANLIILAGIKLYRLNLVSKKLIEIITLPPAGWVGLAIDPVSGSIYVSQFDGNAVFKITPTGEIIQIGSVPSPAGLSISSDGTTLYVSSYYGNSIYSFDTLTNEILCVTTGLSLPDGLTFKDENLFVANRGTNTIAKIKDGCGNPSLFAQGFDNPIDILGVGDNIFVANFNSGTISRVGSDNSVKKFAAGFDGPVGIAHDGTNLIIAEFFGDRIWLLTASNIQVSVAGMTPPIYIECANITTGQTIEIVLEFSLDTSDCTAHGLTVHTGDEVRITITSQARQSSLPSLIEFTHVPAFGTHENLEGQTFIENPEQFAIATYIQRRGWWTKPYWNTPTVPISDDGTFIIDVTTGGGDPYATAYVSYLLPASYNPPILSGQHNIPPEIDDEALAKTTATRAP